MGRNRVEAMDGVMNEVAMDEVGERMRKRMKMKIKTEMAAVGYLLLQAALGTVCVFVCFWAVWSGLPACLALDPLHPP